jgi:hypothetical protein
VDRRTAADSCSSDCDASRDRASICA